METLLKAQLRDKNEKLPADFVAAVVYGRLLGNKILKIKKSDLVKMVNQAGESNLIDLDFGDGVVKVLLKELQSDPLKGGITHADFYQVDMKEKVKTEIRLHFVGESKAVREMSGLLMKNFSEMQVECLPEALVDHIDVDISSLKEYNDDILVKDLAWPVGVKPLHEDNEVIATVLPPRKIEEEVPAVKEEAAKPVETKAKEEVKK
jgi:large subunit ribosomal protein L25